VSESEPTEPGIVIDQARFPAQANEAYRAIGRYLYCFSRLVFHMRQGIVGALGAGSTTKRQIGEIAMSSSTAQPIADAFFAICRQFGGLEVAEEAVANILSRQVNEAIVERNNIVHGDWWIGFASQDATEMDDPVLLRISAARKQGPFVRRELGPTQLDAMSDNLTALRHLVAEFGDLTIGIRRVHEGERVSDFLIVDAKEVRRSGPKANSSRVSYS
jgi:hypothetical protein